MGRKDTKRKGVFNPFTCACTQTYPHAHTCVWDMYTYVYTHVRTHVCAHTHTYARTHKYTMHARMYVHNRTHTCTYATQAHIYAHVHTHIHKQTRTYTHARTRTHAHACAYACRCSAWGQKALAQARICFLIMCAPLTLSHWGLFIGGFQTSEWLRYRTVGYSLITWRTT